MVNIKRLQAIEPYRLELDSGDIVQAKAEHKLHERIQYTANMEVYNKSWIQHEYTYWLNGKQIERQQMKEFLKNKNGVQEMQPEEEN